MTRWQRTWRLGLVLAYAALTVWAQAGHLHGHEKAAETHCDAACNDPSPHYSGHPTPELERLGNDCPICQSRTSLLAPALESPALGGWIVEPAFVAEPSATPLRVAVVPPSRGRPSA